MLPPAAHHTIRAAAAPRKGSLDDGEIASPSAVIGEAAELVPEPLKYAGALVLIALSVRPLTSRFRRKKSASGEQVTFHSGFPIPPMAKGDATQKKPGPSSCGCGMH